jgi:hypothetical protein
MASSMTVWSVSCGRSTLRGTPRFARDTPRLTVRQVKPTANVPNSLVLSNRATRITSRKLLALLRAWSTKIARLRRAARARGRVTGD